jgi:hypothetical protein
MSCLAPTRSCRANLDGKNRASIDVPRFTLSLSGRRTWRRDRARSSANAIEEIGS